MVFSAFQLLDPLSGGSQQPEPINLTERAPHLQEPFLCPEENS
jgi:hypothetical protein